MNFEQKQQFIDDIKKYITEYFPISGMEDEKLYQTIEDIIMERLTGHYCPIDQKLAIVEQVYHSTRGDDLLDTSFLKSL